MVLDSAGSNLNHAISLSNPVRFSPIMRLAFARTFAGVGFDLRGVGAADLEAWRELGRPNVLADRCLRANVVMCPIFLSRRLLGTKRCP